MHHTQEFLIGLEKMVMEEYEEDDDVAEEVSRSSTGAPSRASIDRLRSMPRTSNTSCSGYLDAGLNPSGGGGLNPGARTGSGLGPHGSGAPSVRSSLDMHNGTSSSPSVRSSLDAHRPGDSDAAAGAGAAGVAAAGVAAMGIACSAPAREASAMAAAGAAAWGAIAGTGPGALPRTGSAEARHSSGGAHAHHTNNHVRMDDTPVIVDKALSPSIHSAHASGGGGIAHAHSGGAHELVAAAAGLERGVSGDKVIRSALRNAVDVDAYTGVPADMSPEFL